MRQQPVLVYEREQEINNDLSVLNDIEYIEKKNATHIRGV